jgi:hypothetical protein
MILHTKNFQLPNCVFFTAKHMDIHMFNFATFHEDQKPMLVLQQTQERIQVIKLLSKKNKNKKTKGEVSPTMGNGRRWFKEVSSSHHHWRSFGKGYEKPSHERCCKMMI